MKGHGCLYVIAVVLSAATLAPAPVCAAEFIDRPQPPARALRPPGRPIRNRRTSTRSANPATAANAAVSSPPLSIPCMHRSVRSGRRPARMPPPAPGTFPGAAVTG